MKEQHNILVVEDDLNLGFLLMELLESEGFSVKLSRDGTSGLARFRKEAFDLCILDIMMPEMDGFSLARLMQKEAPEIPFLFLTARLRKEDKIKGYDLGAEDYITKPFDEEEFLCKIRVILRRNQKDNKTCIPTEFNIGNFFFDYKRQELVINGTSQRITEKENEVLRLLCLNMNQILRREDAVESIYGKKDYFLGRSFDVFISRLRKILQADPQISIENVFKVGFILNVKNEM